MLLQNYFMLNNGLLRFTAHIVHPKTVIVISVVVLCVYVWFLLLLLVYLYLVYFIVPVS